LSGCNFFFETTLPNCLQSFPEFCPAALANKKQCSKFFTSIEYCASYPLRPQCQMDNVVGDFGRSCNFRTVESVGSAQYESLPGPDSRCVELVYPGSADSEFGCYIAQCFDNKTKITFTNAQQQVLCTTPNQLITLKNDFQLKCPSDFTKYCDAITFTKKCPNDCSGRGLCNKAGKCICAFSRFGADCSLTYNCPVDD